MNVKVLILLYVTKIMYWNYRSKANFGFQLENLVREMTCI